MPNMTTSFLSFSMVPSSVCLLLFFICSANCCVSRITSLTKYCLYEGGQLYWAFLWRKSSLMWLIKLKKYVIVAKQQHLLVFRVQFYKNYLSVNFTKQRNGVRQKLWSTYVFISILASNFSSLLKMREREKETER